MDYRNERDALRGRVENLEQELDEAKQELHARHSDDKAASVAQLEKQLADAQGLLQEVGRELSALKGAQQVPPGHAPPSDQAAPQSKPPRALMLLGLAAAMVMIAVGVKHCVTNHRDACQKAVACCHQALGPKHCDEYAKDRGTQQEWVCKVHLQTHDECKPYTRGPGDACQKMETCCREVDTQCAFVEDKCEGILDWYREFKDCQL